MPNITPSHAQAVEAAKLVRSHHSACHRLFLEEQKYWDESKTPEHIMARYILSAPPPAPPGDPATAEKCREFVRKCMTEGLKMLSVTTDMQSEHADKTIDRLAAELLAMFAGGTGDPTFCELQALKCVEHLERIFHEDEPSPLMRPEEDDIIRDEVLLVCAVLKSKLPGIPSNTAKGE